MRLFKFLLAFFSVFNIYGQVTVQTSNMKVNGVSITNNTINFNVNSNVSVSFDVNLTTFDGSSNNTLGNLFLFYKASSTESEVQVGSTAVTFIATYPPFVTQTTYSSFIPFASINLTKTSFFATGGTFYVKYINNNNATYTSTNVLIAGGTRTTTTIPPFTQTNTVCCNQTIRRGDKPSLITGSPITLKSGQISAWSKNGFSSGSNNYSTGNQLNTFQSDYLFETCYFKRFVTVGSGNGYNFSNGATITVVQNPIQSNTIYTNAILMVDGGYEISQLSSFDLAGISAQVNLNVLSNPNHVPVRGDIYANSSDITYQWQYRFSGLWMDVPNGNTGNITGFTPEYFTTDYYFRRIAKYQNISLVSNELRIVFRRVAASNTICCDQLLTVTSSSIQLPATILGSTPVFSYADGGNNSPNIATASFAYQWQQQSRSLPWTNIIGANSKDYLPPAITTLGAKISYRRVVRFSYLDNIVGALKTYDTYSNPISISTPNRGARISSGGIVKNDNLFNPEIVIYPNPTFSILNVSNNISFTKTNIKTFNTIGQEIKLNYISLDENSISFDVSSLQKGVYYLSFEKDSNFIIKRFIKE